MAVKGEESWFFFRVRKKQVVCLAWRVVFCFLYLGYLFMWLYTWTSWSACIHTYTVCNISASLSLCVYIYLSIMYVSMHLHVFVCMQGVCTSVPCINVPTCMYIHMQGVCTSVYKCTSVYVHTFKCVCISPCMYVRHSVSILYTHPTVVFLQARDCRAMSVHAPGPCSHECPSINLSYETYLLWRFSARVRGDVIANGRGLARANGPAWIGRLGGLRSRRERAMWW